MLTGWDGAALTKMAHVMAAIGERVAKRDDGDVAEHETDAQPIVREA